MLSTFKRVEFVLLTLIAVLVLSLVASSSVSATRQKRDYCNKNEEPSVSSFQSRSQYDSYSKKHCYFQIEKVWQGDEIDESQVSVEINGVRKYTDEKYTWAPGNKAVKVYPGLTTFKYLEETVTGLPENCTYETDLPEKYEVPAAGFYDKVHTLVVTNTVDCEEEVVEEDPEETPVVAQVTETPVGPVNTGTGSSLSTPLAGLFGSLALVAGGVVARKRALLNL